MTLLPLRNLSVCLYELPLWTKVKNTKVTRVPMKNVIEAMLNNEKRNNFFTFFFYISQCFSSKNSNAFFFFSRSFFLFLKSFFLNLTAILSIVAAFLRLIRVETSHEAYMNNLGNTFMATIACSLNLTHMNLGTYQWPLIAGWGVAFLPELQMKKRIFATWFPLLVTFHY